MSRGPTSRRTQCFDIVLVIFVALIIISDVYHVRHTTNIAYDGSHPGNATSTRTSPTSSGSGSGVRLKEILLWTSFYKDPYYGLSKYGRAGFVERKCRVDACTISGDRRRLNAADAVVVHARNPDMRPLPKRRDARQIFVFFLHEPPPASFWSERYTIPEEDRGSFNLTITYRYDSDIVRPGVGRLVKRPVRAAPANVSAKTRRRPVAWLTSHCRTPGRRELYVRALGRYVDVDVYGKCGPFRCPATGPCHAGFDKTYSFLMAAENAVCKDYASEKVSMALDHDIVPIVYGGLDYKRHLPPNSFIDVMDFASPRELAAYLRQLMADDLMYGEFFAWKATHRRVDVPVSSVMCELCEKLHDPGYHKQYPDIVKWWMDGSCNNSFISTLIGRGLL